MFDVAWSEMAVIAAVALVVIGPKDLPKVMRQMGVWTRKLRRMAGEFQRHMDDIVRESELDEVKRQIERAGKTDIKREVERAIDPTGEVERSLRLDEGPNLARIPTDSAESSAQPAGEAVKPADKPDGRMP